MITGGYPITQGVSPEPETSPRHRLRADTFLHGFSGMTDPANRNPPTSNPKAQACKGLVQDWGLRLGLRLEAWGFWNFGVWANCQAASTTPYKNRRYPIKPERRNCKAETVTTFRTLPKPTNTLNPKPF